MQTLLYFGGGLWLARYCELSDKREKDWLIISVTRSQPLLGKKKLGPTFVYDSRLQFCLSQTGRPFTSAFRVMGGGGETYPLPVVPHLHRRFQTPGFFFSCHFESQLVLWPGRLETAFYLFIYFIFFFKFLCVVQLRYTQR